MRTNVGRCEPGPGLKDLDRAAFRADLSALMTVYQAAMGVAAVQLPGRRSIMEAHLANPGFRAIAVTAPAGTPGDAGPRPAEGSIIAFAYGFHGDRGQWWHDMVCAALTVKSGSAAVTRWLADSFEVAELHVLPAYQRQGIGRRLLYGVTGDRPERTAVLSTMDANSPARKLYRSAGFTDLLTDYRFSGAPVPYAVMGAALPLARAAA